jgi:hypothetical protein
MSPPHPEAWDILSLSLDLSLYPYYKPPWAYRTLLRTGRRAPPCLKQYNPGVSKPNHPDQTHEHTKVYLPAVSNPDSWHAK